MYVSMETVLSEKWTACTHTSHPPQNQGIRGIFYVTVKVHKNENFFGTDFEFCTISLLVVLNF
jgi:hypothetical protein